MKLQHVHLYIFDGLSDWETGYAAAGINNTQFQKDPGQYQVRTVSLDKKTVTTMGGIRIRPDRVIESLTPQDSAMLILPGGTAWDEGKNSEIIEKARMFLDEGTLVAAICGATAGLARGGLLDHRRHTSNAPEYLAATGYKGAELYEVAPTVTDGDLITSPAIAPVDFAYHIFKCLDIYRPPVLEAWYNLYKTGRSEYFGELMKAVNT